ncbi:thiamine biosynthesis protein ThiS [Actinomycetospora sp. NBRC 106375]|uniref:sulfur carrier protein ThiS n=1 Tax=Actinomycetospora sp. NBRC 106375 TaxID=3032207 RepID=UPI0024A4565C|nr:sulfur carrier protein ThiS [Actinomycetospora sp. NBRC 106375]GLZ45718.1 thiamine biosynthesis protein ThiS [Actinomycetospora sp. NBRC 106375]
MTTVWLNDESREVGVGTTVAALMAEHGVPERGVAVAVDGAVVPRAAWATVQLIEGTRVEVLTAVQGG